jgi:hypothetical protein
MSEKTQTTPPEVVDGPPDLGQSLVQTIKQSELPGVTWELLEVAADSALQNDLLRDIPVASTILGLWKTGAAVRDYLLVKKLIAFLGGLRDIPVEQRRDMVARLEADAQFGERVGDEIILLLDRLDATAKATLVGRAFRAYCHGRISNNTLQRINQAIDRLLMRDLAQLPAALTLSPRCCFTGLSQITTQAFINAGLAYVRDGMSSTTIDPDEELCQAMIRYVLD